MRDFIFFFARFTQVREDIIGLPVDDETSDEYEHADDEARIGQPTVGIASRQAEDEVAVERGVHEVEEDAGEHD